MRSFWALSVLTWRHTVRSHIFQLLLFFLLLCVSLIPTTVGAGNPSEFIRVSLLYSVSGVCAILSLSVVWVGCFIMSHDIDDYRLHMVVSKPVSRVTVWLAKTFAVFSSHVALLFLASLAIYGIIMYRYNSFRPEDFPAGEREKIRIERSKIANEVLVGRRVFLPNRPDFNKIAEQKFIEKVRKANSDHIKLDLRPEKQTKMFKEELKSVIADNSRVRFGQQKIWCFENVPSDLKVPLALRYRPYVGKLDSREQKMTNVWWFIGIPETVGSKTSVPDEKLKVSGNYNVIYIPLSKASEQLLGGEFHEKIILPEWGIVTPDRKIFVMVINRDLSHYVHYYQPADGPKLLIPVSGFAANYLRAILVASLQILVLSFLSCAFGGFLTLPTAVFVVACYALFGALSLFLTDPDFYVSGVVDRWGQGLAGILLSIVVPLQDFGVTEQIADGELVEYSHIWYLLWFYVICRVLPFVGLGIFFYRRRQLGLVPRSK